ncbi:NRDE-2, necessary for RNA interference-domain-containing protein [Dichotomopilus funicola]|uniref:NRDE-2, necessary for RNA interference-domain-containing protein n=1 Tax=Dichotomopilus funicola TaxID=1934379 RepID=A0AAN6ZQA3_9PEZI|nr:NRDE-2, necessary for RNA interference-domain-containing protein [Dichotomopilus funicola]
MDEGREKKRRAVPKFGSFQPDPTTSDSAAVPLEKAEARPTLDEARGQRSDRGDGRLGGSEKDSSERRRDREKEEERGREKESEKGKERDRRRHGRDEGRDRDRDRDRHDDRRRDRHRERERERNRPRSTSHPSLGNDLFVVDRRGDPLIVQYGTNDRAQIPVYRRFGAGRIIGSPGFLVIHREGAQEEFSIRRPGEGSGSTSAFRDKALVAAAARVHSKHIKPSVSQPLLSYDDDFIALSTSRKRKRDEDDEDGPVLPDYRSIYGKARPNAHPDDSEDDSDVDSGEDRESSQPASTGPSELSAAQARAVHLSKHLKSDPADVPAWLELIALQDVLFANQLRMQQPTRSLGQRKTAEETRALAELKLGLYQEALDGCVSSKRRLPLVLGMMREGEKVWDEKILVRKWEEVMSSPAGTLFALWKGKLDFEMSRVVGFEVDRLKGIMAEKLASLGKDLEKSVSEDLEREEELCEQLVYVFLRLTRFLHDAGFTELAVAAWQGMLEMTFCRPGENYTPDTAAVSFSEFWESEVARIGEDDAKGWRLHAEAAEIAPDPEPKMDDPIPTPKTTDRFQAWAATEQQLAERARMPARTLDTETEDDAFRVVMFSDIEDLLVWIPSAALSRVKPMLLDALLIFCGMPDAGLSGAQFAGMLLNDPFVVGVGQGIDLGLGLGRGQHGISTESAQDLSRQAPEFVQAAGSMAISPDALFSREPWFRYLAKWSDVHLRYDRQVSLSWLLRTLEQCVKRWGVGSLAEYYLAMEWVNEPARAKKVARGLLKQYGSNIGLYNAYALAEWANGNAEVSLKVLSSATGLTLLPTQPSNQMLYNTWAWIHVESGQKDLALARLCSSVDPDFHDTYPSPALLLKTRSHFSSTRDYAISSQDLATAALYAEGLMLLDYLSATGDTEPSSDRQGHINAALETVHAFSRDLERRGLHLSRSQHHERLLQSAARLLYYHATHGPYRPRTLRTHLSSLLDRFPTNTLSLSLFAWAQPRLRIDDPVRSFLTSLSSPTNPLSPSSSTHPDTRHRPTLSTHRFAIHHQAHAYARSGGIGVESGSSHAICAAFEAVLDSSCDDASGGGGGGRHNVELWLRYIRFCRARWSAAVAQHRNLKTVIYRAMAACPWAKEVYMAATALGDTPLFSPGELRGLVQGMEERGIRMHGDLEGFLGSRTHTTTKGG